MSEGSEILQADLLSLPADKEASKSNIWREWRDQLPQTIVEHVPPLFQSTLDTVARLRADMKEKNSDMNRMAVVVNVHNAKDVLPQTITEIAEQMRQAGMYGEIFIALNNGGGNTKAILNEELCKNADVNKLVFAKTTPLEVNDATDTTTPRQVQIDGEFPYQPGGINLVIMEQYSADVNKGKIRSIRDIYHFLHDLNQKGYAPAELLVIDAETRLRHQNKTEMVGDELSVLRSKRKNFDVVGAKSHLLPYTKDGNPSWNEPVPPLQANTNIVHGTKGFEWLPGGGTLGSFADMVSVMEGMAVHLPGLRVEDTMSTIIMRTLSLKTTVDRAIEHTNRCPAYDSTGKWKEQMLRWFQGGVSARLITGDELYKTTMDNSPLRVILTPFVEDFKKVPHLLPGLVTYLTLDSHSNKNPDDSVNGNAHW